MAQSYFIWNGKDCRGMGITMRAPAAIIRPEERVEHVQIPGRSGDVTETEGENIYNSYIQTVSISVIGGRRVRDVYRWLRGAGYVTFSGEPDKQQKARVIGAITLNRISRNMDRWAGEVQFYCQPLKEKMTSRVDTITSSGSTIRNNGDVDEKPLIRVTASGAIALITIGGVSISLTGLTSGTKYWIDCDTMECWNDAKTSLLTQNSIGDYPVMKPGDNTVTGTGWSQLEFTRRERFL
ncbi:MAG: phage tail family protein [Clostridia bacterium]|nr:phage tail family protein [Clostridia bacterium]